MKYENGYLILDEVDTRLLSALRPAKIEPSYEVNQFLSELTDAKVGATEYMKNISSRNDKTERDELVIETVQLFVEVCDCCIARARQAMADANVVVLAH